VIIIISSSKSSITIISRKNPAMVKAAELKKACAQRGLSPLGYPDELLESLLSYLKTKGGREDRLLPPSYRIVPNADRLSISSLCQKVMVFLVHRRRVVGVVAVIVLMRLLKH